MGLHKSIGYGHGSYNDEIHKEREDNYSLIKAEKFIVLFEAITNEINLNGLKEIPIQQTVYYKVNYLFDAILDVIYIYISANCQNISKFSVIVAS